MFVFEKCTTEQNSWKKVGRKSVWVCCRFYGEFLQTFCWKALKSISADDKDVLSCLRDYQSLFHCVMLGIMVFQMTISTFMSHLTRLIYCNATSVNSILLAKYTVPSKTLTQICCSRTIQYNYKIIKPLVSAGQLRGWSS